jgi:hypothetical protein
MYNSEELFIDKFIACLKKLEVDKIPYDNNDFYNGIEKMQQYFYSNKDSLGRYKDELAMLFIKQPFEGVYSEFRKAFTKQNGWFIAFENPEYIKASIKLDENGATYILNNNDLDIDKEHLFKFAEAFCKGASIPLLTRC